MKIIVCVDDGGGMMFNHRRQSRDRILIDDVLTEIGEERLFIDNYSQSLFENKNVCLVISEDMVNEAKKKDFCFVENIAPSKFASRASEIIIYRWNRAYPGDLMFDIDLDQDGFKLYETCEFEGYSHEKITKEKYKK